MTRQTFSGQPHDIWIVAEILNGQLTPLTKELVYGARLSADMMGFYVKVALLGSNVTLMLRVYPSVPAAFVDQVAQSLTALEATQVVEEELHRLLAPRGRAVGSVG